VIGSSLTNWVASQHVTWFTMIATNHSTDEMKSAEMKSD